jgi:predicted permease
MVIMIVDLNIFYSSLAAVALIVILGFFVGKRGWVDEHTNKTLTNLLLSVAMPCALFTAFPSLFDPDTLQLFFYGFGGGLLVFTAAILVSRLIFRPKRSPKNFFEYQFAFIFNNASFLGFPLVNTIFGQAGLVPYGGFIIVFNLALFSYGIMLFQQKFDWRHLLSAAVNPNVVAVLMGTLFFVLSWQLPSFADQSVRYIGGMMTPMSLICIGFMLSRANLLKVLRRGQLVLTCVLQLTLMPLITYAILRLIKAPEIVVQVLVLIQALPTATSLGLFAEKYRDDTGNASELVALSTILSAVTLPVIMFFLL